MMCYSPGMVNPLEPSRAKWTPIHPSEHSSKATFSSRIDKLIMVGNNIRTVVTYWKECGQGLTGNGLERSSCPAFVLLGVWVAQVYGIVEFMELKA